MYSTKLSANFTLGEFLVSETAARNDIDMYPPTWVVESLERLCKDVLQPVRDEIGTPIVVTSGYRPPALNRLIGGSARSQHMRGEAADIRAIRLSTAELWQRIADMDLPVHQLIHEFGSWVHVSINPFGMPPARQFMSAIRRDGSTVYVGGLV